MRIIFALIGGCSVPSVPAGESWDPCAPDPPKVETVAFGEGGCANRWREILIGCPECPSLESLDVEIDLDGASAQTQGIQIDGTLPAPVVVAFFLPYRGGVAVRATGSGTGVTASGEGRFEIDERATGTVYLNLDDPNIGPPPPISILELSASPMSIDEGQSATLSWRSANAETCELSPGVGPVALNGMVEVSPSVTTTYLLTCRAGGESVSAQVEVRVTRTGDRSLTVRIVGPGSGTVLGGGIDCPGSCAAVLPLGTDVRLVAALDDDSSFGGWFGPCDMGATECGFNLADTVEVVVTFYDTSATPRILVAGGPSGTSDDHPAVLDVNAGAWMSHPPPPGITTLCEAGLVALADGLLLVGGGPGGCSDDGSTTNRAFWFVSDWTEISPMIHARNQVGVARLADGRVMVAGGCAGGCVGPSLLGETVVGMASTAEVVGPFPQSETFTEVAPMGIGRSHTPAAIGLADGRVLVCGGSDGNAVRYTTCETYDPSDDRWIAAGETTGIISSPANPIALLVSGLVLAGNSDGQVERFDPISNAWSLTAPNASPRSRMALVALPDGRALAVGGLGQSVLDSVEIYDPIADAWGLLPVTMSTPRERARASLLDTGWVLVSGGRNGSIPLTSVELFDPVTGAGMSAPPMDVARVRHFQTTIP